MKTPRLLIVDDEPEIGDFVRKVAEDLGFDVRVTDQSETFKELYREFDPDVLVLDLVIPDTDGIELMQFLADSESKSRIVLMSGFNTEILRVSLELGSARNLNMAGSLPKPVRVAELRSILSKVREPPDC